MQIHLQEVTGKQHFAWKIKEKDSFSALIVKKFPPNLKEGNFGGKSEVRSINEFVSRKLYNSNSICIDILKVNLPLVLAINTQIQGLRDLEKYLLTAGWIVEIVPLKSVIY